MRATYDRIYLDLKRQIEDGDYQYEDMLPSQTVLVNRYGCAHNTARKALDRLASEGYCQPIHGKGVRVIWRPSVKQTSFVTGGIETFAETARRNNISAKTEIKVFETITCDKALARLTGFVEGSELLHIERVRVLDGQALIHDKNYFDAHTVEGLTPEQAANSIFRYLEEKRGVYISTSKRTITADRVSAEDRQWLDLGDADFMIVMTNQTFDKDGFMFEYTQSRHHPDHFCFETTTRRSK